MLFYWHGIGFAADPIQQKGNEKKAAFDQPQSGSLFNRWEHSFSEIYDKITKQEFFTGDWNGQRTRLADQGVELGGTYIGEIFSNVSGGTRQGIIYEGLAELFLSMDCEKLIGLKGGEFHIHSYYPHGPSLTGNYVNDLSTVSNIDAYDSPRLEEAWYQQTFLEDILSFKIGQLAVDKEFFISDYGSLFISGTFGAFTMIGTDLPNPPVYPLAVPGARLRIGPSKLFYIQAGIYDGDSGAQALNSSGTHWNLGSQSNMLSFYEAGYKLNQEEKNKGLPGTYKVGAFLHTGKFTDVLRDNVGRSAIVSQGSPLMHDSNYGFYFIVDQMFCREPTKENVSQQGLGVFYRVGTAPDDRNRISFYSEGGLSYQGLLPGRDEDLFGMGIAYSQISEDVRQSGRDDRDINRTTGIVLQDYETVLELTYQIAITPWWKIQPDIQYILHPGGSSTIDDAVVLGCRFNLSF